MSETKIHPTVIAGYAKHPRVDLLPGGFGSSPFRVAEDVRFWSVRMNRWIVIPEYFQSDLLSIPGIFTRILPRGGYGKRAAIAHDFLCVDRPEWCSSDDAADVFDEALEIDGVPTWRRVVMVWAVRNFGPQWERMDLPPEGGA